MVRRLIRLDAGVLSRLTMNVSHSDQMKARTRDSLPQNACILLGMLVFTDTIDCIERNGLKLKSSISGNECSCFRIRSAYRANWVPATRCDYFERGATDRLG